ncbi:MAG: beta-ketoacyl-ACP synthase II [Nitrospirota bacterium]
MKRRVVVTGLGVVASNGIGKEEFWQANIEGRSGISLVEGFDTTKLNTKIAGQIKSFKPSDYLSSDIIKRTDRFVHLGMAAAKLAIADAALNLAVYERDNVGVCIGSGSGGVSFHEEQIIGGMQKGLSRIHPSSLPKITANAIASHISILFNVTGPNLTISNACASGTNAVGQAFRIIQNGEADIIIAGGAEAPITPFCFSAYSSMHVLSKRNDAPSEASRPFDKERDGFVVGEGAGILILEELSLARARGAHIYAEVIGYASNSGAYHMVMPEPEGKDAAKVIAAALKDADVKIEEIDYINAHGTSTQANDRLETKAIKEIFGKRAYNIPISSTKSMIGHCIGAAGGIEAVVCSLVLENNLIPPTINYCYHDPECDLDYVPNKARKARVNVAVSNSFGFGNNNACIVMKKFD